MPPIFLIPLFVVCFWLIRRYDEHVLQKSFQASDEAHVLQMWIIDHIDDCVMSDEKWRAIIPLCQFADEQVKLHCKYPIRETDSCETFVRQIIGEESEDVSA